MANVFLGKELFLKNYLGGYILRGSFMLKWEGRLKNLNGRNLQIHIKECHEWKCTSESLAFLWEKPTAQQVNDAFWIVNDWFCLQRETQKYWLRYCKYLRKKKCHSSGMSRIEKGQTAWETRSEQRKLSTKGAKWKRVQKIFKRISLYRRCNGAEKIRNNTDSLSLKAKARGLLLV